VNKKGAGFLFYLPIVNSKNEAIFIIHYKEFAMNERIQNGFIFRVVEHLLCQIHLFSQLHKY